MTAFPTIAALLTPHGRGAVAVIAVRGPQADAFVQQYFHAANRKAVALQQPGRIVYGRWGNALGEEVLLVRQSPDGLEIHCHGGLAAPRAILADLQLAGCRMTDAWEFVAGHAPDIIQQEAARALADATTERTAAILLDQYRGALRQAFAEIETASAAKDATPAQRARIERLLALADVGRHLTRPWQVVIAGRPNVGKSSLINALAGYERAIVFDAPGTTRDSVSVLTAFDGWPVELTDTAGIRQTGDALELRAIGQSRQRLAAAELVVLVFDRSQPWSDEDEHLLHGFPEAIVVHNKRDLAAKKGTRPCPAGLLLNATTGAGLPDLFTEMVRRLVPHPPQAGEAVPFTDRQVAQLLAWQSGQTASS